MQLYQVVAMARNRVIGKDNRLPWHFSSDLKHFKQLTIGSTVLMGRKTFESIGKPLPGRQNFVVSRTKTTPHLYPPPLVVGGIEGGLKFFTSIEDALKNIATKNCYIIGGANLFKRTIDRVDGIYMTRIDEDFEGDTYFPKLPSHFKEKTRELLQEKPKIELIFYERDFPSRERKDSRVISSV